MVILASILLLYLPVLVVQAFAPTVGNKFGNRRAIFQRYYFGSPASTPNYYDILGASYEDTKEELKAKYKAAAKRTHPDVTKSSGHFTNTYDFRQVNAAYHVLSDDRERYEYDRSLGIYDPIVGGCPNDALDSFQAISMDVGSFSYYGNTSF